MIGFIVASNGAAVVATIFQCLPISYSWNGWKGNFGDRRCINLNALVYAASAFNITQELLLIILPLPLLVRLKLSTRQRINVVVLFSLGVFNLITSCIRLRFIVRFARSANPTWDYIDTFIWTSIEMSVSVIVPCLPILRAWLGKTLPSIFSSASRTQDCPFSDKLKGGPFPDTIGGGRFKGGSTGQAHTDSSGIFTLSGSLTEDGNESREGLRLPDKGAVLADVGAGKVLNNEETGWGVHIQAMTVTSMEDNELELGLSGQGDRESQDERHGSASVAQRSTHKSEGI